MGREEGAVSLFLKLEYDLEESQGGLERTTDAKASSRERLFTAAKERTSFYRSHSGQDLSLGR